MSGPQKDLAVAYALSALGCCGFCGIHRIYLENIPSGIIWFLTGGLCGIGQLVDLFLMPSLVQEANNRTRPTTVVTVTTATPVMVAQPQMYQATMPNGQVVMMPGQAVMQPGQVVMMPPGQVVMQPGQVVMQPGQVVMQPQYVQQPQQVAYSTF